MERLQGGAGAVSVLDARFRAATVMERLQGGAGAVSVLDARFRAATVMERLPAPNPYGLSSHTRYVRASVNGASVNSRGLPATMPSML